MTATNIYNILYSTQQSSKTKNPPRQPSQGHERVLFHGSHCYFEICCYLYSKGSNPPGLIPWDSLRVMISITEVHARTQRSVVPHCQLSSHRKPAAVPPHPTTPSCVSPFCTNLWADFSQNFPIFFQLQANRIWLHAFKNTFL